MKTLLQRLFIALAMLSTLNSQLLDFARARHGVHLSGSVERQRQSRHRQLRPRLHALHHKRDGQRHRRAGDQQRHRRDQWFVHHVR